jgi:hypothetical protein
VTGSAADDRRLLDELTRALLWLAAFAFACGVFFSITLLLRNLPPTPPRAIGVVTIERYSKLHDYVIAALFFLLVPPLTIWFRRIGARVEASHRRAVAPEHRTLASILFSVPYLLSPAFYLTTGKAGWILLLPLALSNGAPRAIAFADHRLWLRRLLRPEMWPFHALTIIGGLSWILFRYLVVWRRIAHIPTLFLELVFLILFLAVFVIISIYAGVLAKLLFGVDVEAVVRRAAVAASLLVILPVVAIVWVPTPYPGFVVIIVLLGAAIVAMRGGYADTSEVWKLAAWLLIPLLLYCISYASTAQLSQWIDLFHRGETIGPASDYLRGKVPYRDVFVLHGMMEDGQLDAWLMQIFGRSIDVSVTQSVVLGGFLVLSLWYLGIVLFESIPLALLVVAMGAWTTAENTRTFFQVAAVAFFWHGLKRRRRSSLFVAGALAAVALFFSYEIGVYTIVGGLLAIALLAIAARRAPSPLPLRDATLFFVAGIVAGCIPFLAFLAVHGALGDFLQISFVTIPRIIDAVWSLPFPDLVSTFRTDLNLHTLSDFILYEKFHLIVSPLTIAIAAVYCIQRWLRRRMTVEDQALLVLTVFALVAQRTAFGRAEFRHQYFAAFLIGPILVLLAVILIRRVREIWQRGDAGARAFIAAAAVAAIPAIAILFWVPDLINSRIEDFRRYQARVLRVFRDGNAEAVQGRINAVVAYVQSLTKANEPIFDFSNQPAFYFFANRPNPTRFYQVPIMSPPGFQAEAIRALERAQPKVVIRRSPEGFDDFDGVSNNTRAQAVAAYLDDCYAFYRNARGVEIWRRKPGVVAAPVAQYVRRISLPRSNDLVNPSFSREVFPLIGSGTGIAGAYWQSDLTMQNPHREPIQVTLRYVSADQRIDRRIDLGGSRMIRWDDVVRTLFRMPASTGSLWLEYVNGRAPVVVVHSWDSVHDAHGSIDSPLTMSDSATAGSPTADLLMLGVPARPPQGRRINMAIVNVGNIPATFRITARRSDGARVGRAILNGVEEDGVWVVHDVESELGAAIDEGAMIRVSVIAGTGVAYASVVQPNGDVLNITAVPAQSQ